MDSKASPLVLILALVISCFIPKIKGCGINIRNLCPYPVTACARSAADPTALYQLPSGGSQYMDFGTACRWPSAVLYASVGGKCTDTNEANIAEFNIGGGTDYYALSNIDAYTIGMQITPYNNGCKAPRCYIPNIPAFCQPKNQLKSFPTGAYACHNVDGLAGYPTSNNKKFKDACPDAYSYNYDHATSLFTCGTGTNYIVDFCPTGKVTSEEAFMAAIEAARVM